ncbi:MAG TPA: alpha/beta hydrolase [Candidatus Baltobacteraceae bacterium]|jgi:pimeloyl-ACP methyl ester carboxylesterase|nr:alpha/beta hydrolase [Candidatus Baltobacteraceae bacterium]
MNVLFIHGLIGHMRAPEIDARFGSSALAPNLLGYGEHSGYEGEISLPTQVEFLHELLHDRGIERVHAVGHSIGGAIAMLFAREYPNHTLSVINVEGNFTLKDAFWSAVILAQTFEASDKAHQASIADPAAWLAASGVTPTPERIAMARSHLENQPISTMRAMAKSVIETTGKPKFLDDVMTVLNNGTPMHLIAGERSRQAWDVPPFVLDNAPLTTLPNTGHLITIESPSAFAQAVAELVHM